MTQPSRNQHTGLIGFGLLFLLLGLGILVICAALLLGSTMAAPNRQLPASAMSYVVGFYPVLGVFLLALGFGSLLGRRWSRPLI